jgi:uncharacterized protein
MIRRLIETDCEVRALDGDLGKVITGYAATFGKLSQDLGGFRERIEPGTFIDSIQKNDVRALWSHNVDIPLGRTGNGTLVLEENTRGLKFTLSLPDTQAGRDAFISVKRGDVSGVSFGFNLIPDGRSWEYQEDKTVVHVLKRVDLLEVSPTAFPAYESTSVWARSSKTDLEQLMREADEFRLTQEVPLEEVVSNPKFPFARERLRLSLRRIGRK